MPNLTEKLVEQIFEQFCSEARGSFNNSGFAATLIGLKSLKTGFKGVFSGKFWESKYPDFDEKFKQYIRGFVEKLPLIGQQHLLDNPERKIEFTRDIFRAFDSFSKMSKCTYKHDLALQNFERVNLHKASYQPLGGVATKSIDFIMNDVAPLLEELKNICVKNFFLASSLSILATQNIDPNLLCDQEKARLCNLLVGIVVGLASDPSKQNDLHNPLAKKFTTDHRFALPAHIITGALDAAVKFLSDPRTEYLYPDDLLNKGMEIGRICQQDSILLKNVKHSVLEQEESIAIVANNLQQHGGEILYEAAMEARSLRGHIALAEYEPAMTQSFASRVTRRCFISDVSHSPVLFQELVCDRNGHDGNGMFL